MSRTDTTDYAKVFDRLCHFVALSKTVDVDAVIDNLVVSTLACDGGFRPASTSSVSEAVNTYFGLDFSNSTLEASLDRLLDSGNVLRNSDGTYALPPAVAADATKRFEAAMDLESHVRNEWLTEVSELEPRISSEQKDRLWSALQSYMAKAFHRHGVQTVQLLDPTVPIPPEVDTGLSVLLENAIEANEIALPAEIAKGAIRSFFRNQTPNRIKYLVQLLDGTFSFFALSTDEATSRYLRGAFQPMTIFLDTNFIFGILGLSSNPLVAVSHELVSFIGRHNLPFTLYYHTETLEEMQRVVHYTGAVLTENQWQRALSRAAVRTGQMSGLELRYHELNAESPTDPEVFLAKYQHPEPLLREHGFRIFREHRHSDDYVEQRAKLVAEYEHFIETRRRPKPYEAYKHDMAVWMAARERRTATSSVLEAGSILLSCDYYLYAFDQNILRKEPQLGLVVLPNHFLQMLRPLFPASDDFDRRFVETFAIPEFRVVGSDYSAAASKVLSYLNQFSDVGEETAILILADELLIQKLRGVDEDSEEFSTSIENALARANEELLEEIAQWKLEAQQEREEKKKALQEAKTTERALAKKEEEVKELRQIQTEDRQQLESLVAKVEQLERNGVQTEHTLQQEVAAVRADAERVVSRWRIAFGAFFSLVGIAVLLGAPQIRHWQWLADHLNRLGLYLCAILILIAIGWGIGDPKRRKWALGTLGLGAFLVLTQIIGR